MSEKNYYVPPPPLNKPEKTMKLRYVGESFGVTCLTNGKVYEAWFDDESLQNIDDALRIIRQSDQECLHLQKNSALADRNVPNYNWEDAWKNCRLLRVIDDSGEDYLYSPTNPAPPDGSGPGGRWEIIEE